MMTCYWEALHQFVMARCWEALRQLHCWDDLPLLCFHQLKDCQEIDTVHLVNRCGWCIWEKEGRRAGGWHGISSWVRIRKVGGSLKPPPSTFFSTALWSFLWWLLRKGRRVPRICKLLETSRPQLHQSVSANFSLCWWETCYVDWNRKWVKAKVTQEQFLCDL